MSLVRRTSIAVATVAGLMLVLVAATTVGAAGQAGKRRSEPDARWVPAHSNKGAQKGGHKGAHKGGHKARGHKARGHRARMVTFRHRLLGAQPVLSYRGFADPTVARHSGGWVGVSTGPAAPRAAAPRPGGPWQNIPSALTTLPRWATSGRIWASDLVQVRNQWLLYFSAPVAGLGSDGRCIGVATASDPTQSFIPDQRPVVCPRQAAAPAAYDKVKRRARGLPRSGVIDPDQFRDRDGKRYLLYRTQGTPSTIRMVRLPRSGRPVGASRQSTELVRRSGVIENPALLRRGRQYVLLTSEGQFGECTYKTTFRRSMRLTDWSRSNRQVLVDARKSGLCGPGGADLGQGPAGEPLLFFHAWTCPELGGNCPGGHNYDRDHRYDARRSLFAGVLRFTKRQSPRIRSYVAPVASPPQSGSTGAKAAASIATPEHGTGAAEAGRPGAQSADSPACAALRCEPRPGAPVSGSSGT